MAEILAWTPWPRGRSSPNWGGRRMFPPRCPTTSCVLENLRLAGGSVSTGTGTSSRERARRAGCSRCAGRSGLIPNAGPCCQRPVHAHRLPGCRRENGTRHFEWPNGSGSHVLINQAARQVFLMDRKMYGSMMVQMLIAPPSASRGLHPGRGQVPVGAGVQGQRVAMDWQGRRVLVSGAPGSSGACCAGAGGAGRGGDGVAPRAAKGP